MIIIKEDRIVDDIRSQVKKWKKQIREATHEHSKDYIIMLWLGYLNGIRMAGVITYKEYIDLHTDMKKYVEGLETARAEGGHTDYEQKKERH